MVACVPCGFGDGDVDHLAFFSSFVVAVAGLVSIVIGGGGFISISDRPLSSAAFLLAAVLVWLPFFFFCLLVPLPSSRTVFVPLVRACQWRKLLRRDRFGCDQYLIAWR